MAVEVNENVDPIAVYGVGCVPSADIGELPAGNQDPAIARVALEGGVGGWQSVQKQHLKVCTVDEMLLRHQDCFSVSE